MRSESVNGGKTEVKTEREKLRIKTNEKGVSVTISPRRLGELLSSSGYLGGTRGEKGAGPTSPGGVDMGGTGESGRASQSRPPVGRRRVPGQSVQRDGAGTVGPGDGGRGTVGG